MTTNTITRTSRRSLTTEPINATHAQTLFNASIVRADGNGDNAGAVAVGDALLKSNPQYPDITRGRRKT